MMVMVIMSALLGAVVGILVRRAVLAVAVAMAGVLIVRYAALSIAAVLVREPGQAHWGDTMQFYVGMGPLAVVPGLAAAGFGAGIAAIMLAMTSARSGGFWLPEPEDAGAPGKHRHKRANLKMSSNTDAQKRIHTVLNF